jgi:hypothetical protein
MFCGEQIHKVGDPEGKKKASTQNGSKGFFSVKLTNFKKNIDKDQKFTV